MGIKKAKKEDSFKELFEENNIKHQDYISLGGTDAGAIHLTREGVPTLTMCLY